jgi:hypothetical protein
LLDCRRTAGDVLEARPTAPPRIGLEQPGDLVVAGLGAVVRQGVVEVLVVTVRIERGQERPHLLVLPADGRDNAQVLLNACEHRILSER